MRRRQDQPRDKDRRGTHYRLPCTHYQVLHQPRLVENPSSLGQVQEHFALDRLVTEPAAATLPLAIL